MANPRIALITGASAGIGAEFARQLAAQGHHLALTARRVDRLDELAAELKERYGIECLTIAADLADPEAPKQIMQTITAAGFDVEVLINNAGFAVGGFYTAATWAEQARFLQVMVTAVAELTHLALPKMLENDSGQIVNVASVAGIVAGSSGHTLYAASKAFLIKFSESLAMENHHTGVAVQALCPGFTLSEFHDVIGNRHLVSQMPDYMWMEAQEVVAISLEQLKNPKAPVMLVPGRVNRFLAFLSRKLPYRWAYALVRKRSGDFRLQERPQD